ncbi:hypothetical protein UFOVP1623_52 [uncultured Caudovirales phage]|uniref:Uncharacterized protein n=1 Tax=uncultured Caudovirales phage TaxID=2100421 RepID=A0A6J5S1Q2_9CAUD|nr:hypothetical protein UFOVP1376_11 [uncultured Caudovirales phage]CAB4220863.1 hypothetical protein UFOVP1623_52 [uncultured Caudovirales phage]
MTTVSPNLYARRGHQVWAAGTPWANPSIGLGPYYSESVPPGIHGSAKWLCSNAPGLGGLGCVDPGPNMGYSVRDGALDLKSGVPGWSMISRETFPRTQYVSLQWVMAGKVTDPVPDAFHSVGFYNGERDYRTVNLMRGTLPGKLNLVLLSEPDHRISTLVENYTVENGYHLFRIDHEFGTWRYFADDVLLREETSGPLSHDFHICVFMGGMDGSLGSMVVNVE